MRTTEADLEAIGIRLEDDKSGKENEVKKCFRQKKIRKSLKVCFKYLQGFLVEKWQQVWGILCLEYQFWWGPSLPGLHTCIPLLASRCGVYLNWPPADVHPFSDLFHFKLLNHVKVLITSY
jgi:hypothetical protein